MATALEPTRESGILRWARALVGNRDASPASDVALAAVRIALAWIFLYYGGGKLFGWWNGPGIHETSVFMADTAGLHPGGFFAVLGGIVELGGAIAIALGLGARLVGAALFGDMLIAIITVTGSRGINSEQVPPGYELNVTLAVLALVVVLLGAGRWSVDRLVARRIGVDTRE
jgi:putative oxidoreductase